MAEEQKVRDVIDAVKGVAETVPLYQDLVQLVGESSSLSEAESIRLAAGATRSMETRILRRRTVVFCVLPESIYI